MRLHYAWMLLPAAAFYMVICQCTVNIPMMDDYEAVLQTVHDFGHAHGWEKLAVLIRQHNEHRLLSSRLIFVGYYYLTGSINFNALIWIADLQLLVAAVIVLSFIRKYSTYWPIVGAIWMLCLFDANTYESASIAMYGMQNYGVVMLFFTGLYLYHRKWMIPAAICQALMIFSAGNGLVGSVALTVFLLGYSRKWAVLPAAVTVVFAGLYYVGYQHVTQPNQLPFDLNRVITFFICNAGCYLDFDNSFVLGVLILGVLAWIFPWRTIRQNWLIISVLIFVLGSMAGIAYGRACLEHAQPQGSRYLIYPQLLIAIIAYFLYQKESTNWKGFGLRIAFFLLVLKSYGANFQFGRMGFERLAARAQNMKFYHPDQAKAKAITDTACQDGVYCIGDNR